MEYMITASEQEISALRQMLHRACLHSGIDVAAAAAHWNQKLTEAVAAKSNGGIAAAKSTANVMLKTNIEN